ncbi:MAG: hypothetical protein GY699_18925 [Desulfobacteraceae bacterium]|nr:hypothetical protein [Desulfobacteraceae bacterium]
MLGVKCGKAKSKIFNLLVENADRAEQECRYCTKKKMGTDPDLPPCCEEESDIDCDYYTERWGWQDCSLARIASLDRVPPHIQKEIDSLNNYCQDAIIGFMISCPYSILGKP